MNKLLVATVSIVGMFLFGSTETNASGTTNPPSGLVITTISGQCKQLRLTWNDNSSVETNFRVERSPTGGGAGFVEIATVAGSSATTKTYTDSTVNDFTTYWYRVRYFITPSTFSTYSNEASGNSGIVCTPTGLAVAALLSSCSKLNLSWTDNSKVDTNYEIERRTGTCTGAFTLIASISGNGVTTGLRSYQDTNLVGATQYSYRVRAKSGATYSAYSTCAGNTVTACNATK